MARPTRADLPRDVRGQRERKQGKARIAEDRDARGDSGRRRRGEGAILEGENRKEHDEGEQQSVQPLAVQVHVVPDDVRMQCGEQRGDDPDPRRAQASPDLQDEQRSEHRHDNLCEADREPGPAERQVDRCEEPAVERLRIRGRDPGQEAERPVVDQRRGEAVALVDELLENRLALVEEHGKSRERRGEADDENGDGAAHHTASDDTSRAMGGTAGERYAVVSCHVERPLDDEVWARFSALQQHPPGGFRIAALVRPADPAAGEDADVWLERVRQAAELGAARPSHALDRPGPRAAHR